MIIINYKNYPESTAVNAEKLTNLLQRYIEKYPLARDLVAIAPSVIDLLPLKLTYSEINTIAQHVDAVEKGKSTGKIPAQGLVEIGVNHSLLNHSEHRLDQAELFEHINFVQGEGMDLIVCVENIEEAEAILPAAPYAIALEPPELIGSGTSMTDTDPSLVTDFVKFIEQKSNGAVLPYVGAGVAVREDIEIALNAGAKGFLIASALVKAENFEQKLTELLEPYGA